jgi:predicted metalloprotease
MKRYILYNPEFVNKVNEVTKDKWASIFILAHEVGHHSRRSHGSWPEKLPRH